MGYRIDYDKGTARYEVSRNRPWRRFVLTAVCFVLFLVLTGWFWPEGSDLIRDILIPGNDAVTVHAFAKFTEELREGTSIRDAVTVFCREVLIGEPAVR